jgi:triosephosphate isomerase (TIM)
VNMARTPLIAGNWKMHKTQREAERYLRELMPALDEMEGVQVAICAPYTDLQLLADGARGASVEIYAQNMHQEAQGPFTGEVSAQMLGEIGVQGVVLGHSERREYFGETDQALALKVPAALAAGLTPILCVGESEQERDAERTESKLRHQIGEDLAGVDAARVAELVIAYEPIWAIGTGRTATPEQAQEAIAFIRALLAVRDERAAAQVRILYGGSATPANAGELLALEDVDGALVGGASLEVESFTQIVAAASR